MKAETEETRALTAWARGLHHVSDLLIRRGTAMGPLVPSLLLAPFFLVAACVFQSQLWLAVPCFLVAAFLGLHFAFEFSRFARKDPDRLQSEEYRSEMTRLHYIAAKDLPMMPAELLDLAPIVSNPAQPQLELPPQNNELDEEGSPC